MKLKLKKSFTYFNSKFCLDNKKIENLPIDCLEIFILMNYL